MMAWSSEFSRQWRVIISSLGEHHGGAKGRTSYGGNQAGRSSPSTEQGPTSGSHHAALPCAAVSRAGPSVWNNFSNPWSMASLIVQVSTWMSAPWTCFSEHRSQSRTLVSLITLLCFLHSTALGSGSKILPYLHYHLSLDSLHVASCTIRSSVLPTCLALRRLQWVLLDEWTRGPEPSFNFWLLPERTASGSF